MAAWLRGCVAAWLHGGMAAAWLHAPTDAPADDVVLPLSEVDFVELADFTPWACVADGASAACLGLAADERVFALRTSRNRRRRAAAAANTTTTTSTTHHRHNRRRSSRRPPAAFTTTIATTRVHAAYVGKSSDVWNLIYIG